MRAKIQTKRLILRRFAARDWQPLMDYAGARDVAIATARLPHPYTYEDAINWIELTMLKAKAEHIYAIADLDDHCIGCVSLISNPSGWELGYWLGKPHWHQGYMREATTTLLTEARQNIAPTKISATVFKDNPRSLALLLSLGFSIIGQDSEFCLARGHDVPTHKLTLKFEEESPDA